MTDNSLTDARSNQRPIIAAAGILACNEEEAIGPMLESLFRQSFFERLQGRKFQILVVTNGCTDKTPETAQRLLEEKSRTHPGREAFEWQVINLSQRGKLNAWNQFVHRYSAREAEFLFLMDGDILLEHPDTLWNMQM